MRITKNTQDKTGGVDHHETRRRKRRLRALFKAREVKPDPARAEVERAVPNVPVEKR